MTEHIKEFAENHGGTYEGVMQMREKAVGYFSNAAADAISNVPADVFDKNTMKVTEVYPFIDGLVYAYFFVAIETAIQAGMPVTGIESRFRSALDACLAPKPVVNG